ncbi:hypothetical protein KAF25_000712 [Fusarium avenaceum]|uniref:Mid2 domain-containing protein n=1 Tax=Fusarium avenaceum TaxID=40199 RepID=A0A9P7GSJ6_9HYPO|nr:hypothetical protein KAF25_000712 [Fusarium avenaceum]
MKISSYLALSPLAGVANTLAITEAIKRPNAGYVHQPESTPMVEFLDDLRHLALGKRQATSTEDITYTLVNSPDSTCGFLSGSPGNAITCSNGEKCSWELAHVTGIFCGTSAYNRCLDRSDALDTKLCNDVCQSNSYNLLCTDKSAPFCGTYAYESGVRGFRCASSTLTGEQSVSFMYNGQKDRKFSTTYISDEVTTTTTSETTESSSQEQGSATSTTSATTTSGEPEPQNTGGGGGSKTNVGAIVGGAIGGFVVLSLIVLGIIWFMRRNKKNGNSPPQQPTPAVVPQPHVPQTPADTVPPMSQHYAKSGVTSPTQSEWRDSMVTAQSPGSPVSNMTWTGQYPAQGQGVYHEMPQGGSYGR